MTIARSCLVVVNKPTGMTSRQAVDRVARAVRPAKAGHAGTLDPLATGVLVVGVGQATRLVEYIQRMPKQYRARFLLGRTSASEDVETPVQELPGAAAPTLAEVVDACGRFTGTIQQRPPAYSAIKQAGRRAYALARAGHDVQLESRPVEIFRLNVVQYDYPELELDVECGSGTYVRSLGRDLAASLGTGAVMSALTRTRIGAFTIGEAVAPDAIDAQRLDALATPLERAVAELPSLLLKEDDAARLRKGQAIAPPTAARPTAATPTEYAALDEQGKLIAILAAEPTGILRPTKVFGPS